MFGTWKSAVFGLYALLSGIYALFSGISPTGSQDRLLAAEGKRSSMTLLRVLYPLLTTVLGV